MTGNGKTGLGVTLIEEAAIDGVPIIAIDPKGDLGNLLLTFPDLTPEAHARWTGRSVAKGVGEHRAGPRAYRAFRECGRRHHLYARQSNRGTGRTFLRGC